MPIEAELDDEIRNSQAIIYYHRLEAIKLNYYIFQSNFLELKIPIENMKDPNKSLPFWDLRKRDQLEQIQFEVIRRLLNYIISAKSLVEYTRNMIKDGYSNTEFKIEYDAEITKRFNGNDLVSFVEDLRNYSTHYSLPITQPSFSVTGINSNNQQFTHKFIMSKSVLLEWKNWEKGKKFLINAPEEIEVESFAYEYFSIIESFDRWLYKKLVDLHKKELDWLIEKSRQLNSFLDILYRD